MINNLQKYNFSFEKPVIGYGNFSTKQKDVKCMIDQSIVNHKIDLWKKSVLNPPKDNSHLSLLRDKTILAFNYFKFNGKPFRSRWYQDVLMFDSYDRILYASSNQSGKSISLNVDAATEFFQDHGKGWVGLLVSNSLPQSQYQMDRIKMMLKSSNIQYRVEDTTDKKTGKKDNSTQISYTFYEDDELTPRYTNLLICCPHTSSALGYPCDNMWLDEFDFWENCDQRHFIYQIAIPRTFDTKGKIKIFSNPNGKERMMYELWNLKDAEGNFVWHRYNFNYWDTPNANQKDFDKNVTGMTPSQIDSTLLARFARTEGSFFSTEEIEDTLSKELIEKGDSAGYGRDTAWFLDVGTVHDQSCLIGAYLEQNEQVPEIPKINLFYVHKYPVGFPLARVVGVDNAIDSEDGWDDYVKDNPPVKSVLGKYGHLGADNSMFYPLFGCDVTGNRGLIPLFQAIDIDVIPIEFQGKNKWYMFQRYQYYVQQRFLKRNMDRDENTVRGCDFSYQMSKLIVKKTANQSYNKIHHENEDDLDDTQDSVAGVIHLIENPDLPSLSFEIINEKGIVTEEVEEEIKEQHKLEKEGQYIPSFYDRSELDNWIEQKEKQFH